MYKIPESVLVVIYTKDLQVLLMERADKLDYWQSVTGSKDFPEEALAATAMREVQEETGIVVSAEAGAVPLSNLHYWDVANVYEIYPVWRHRYAHGVTKTASRLS